MGPYPVGAVVPLVHLFSLMPAIVVKDVPLLCKDAPRFSLAVAVELVWQWFRLSQLLNRDMLGTAIDRELQGYMWTPGYCWIQGDIANKRCDVQVTHYVV